MSFSEITHTIALLARSTGRYGRLLRAIEEMDDETRDEFAAHLEAQNFTDEIDMIMYFEG